MQTAPRSLRWILLPALVPAGCAGARPGAPPAIHEFDRLSDRFAAELRAEWLPVTDADRAVVRLYLERFDRRGAEAVQVASFRRYGQRHTLLNLVYDVSCFRSDVARSWLAGADGCYFEALLTVAVHTEGRYVLPWIYSDLRGRDL